MEFLYNRSLCNTIIKLLKFLSGLCLLFLTIFQVIILYYNKKNIYPDFSL